MTATIAVRFPYDQREELHEFPAGFNLAEALMKISPDRWGGMTFEVYEGAPVAAGLKDLTTLPDITLEEDQLWIVIVLPAEVITATALIASLAATMGGGALATVAATVIVYAAMAAISMAISFAVSMLLRPGKQSDKAPAASDQPSSLNSLSPPKNTMRPMSRIPDLYGRLRHWPDLITPGTAWWVFSNTPGGEHEFVENRLASSDQYVEAVYCVGRGTYSVENPRFGDTSIYEQGGSIQVYLPGQTLPSSIKMSWPVPNLSRTELGRPGGMDNWTPWFEIPSRRADEIWVQITWPSGIIFSVSGKKVVPPYNVQWEQSWIEVQCERLDDDDVVVETTSFTQQFGNKTRNELRSTMKMSVNSGRWRVRVKDVYPGTPPYPNGNHQEGFAKGYLEGITGLETLDDDDRTFEEETIVVVQAYNRAGTASQNLEAFNAIFNRVLPTQDPNGAPGVFLPASANALWITAAIHTLTDPTLCGYQHREVDWASLVDVQASLWNYPAGFEEPNFNGIFDRQMSADEQLTAISNKARAMHFVSNGRITFARDERRAGVSAIFNRRNRMADRGSLGLGLRLPGPDESDGVEINWIDQDDDFRQKTYTFPEDQTSMNPTSIDLVGATKAHEVCRRARFEWAANKYRRRTQPLRVTEEGQLIMPFDRVGVVPPWEENIIDGEVLEQDDLTLRLDRTVPALPDGACIRLRSPDGRETQLISVVSRPDLGPDWVETGSAPTFSFVVPGAEEQLGTLYNLSMNDAIDAATFWLMTGAEIDDRGVVLTLIEDSDMVYQLSDDLLDPCIDLPPGCVELENAINISSVVLGVPSTGDWFARDTGAPVVFQSSPLTDANGVTYTVASATATTVQIEATVEAAVTFNNATTVMALPAWQTLTNVCNFDNPDTQHRAFVSWTPPEGVVSRLKFRAWGAINTIGENPQDYLGVDWFLGGAWAMAPEYGMEFMFECDGDPANTILFINGIASELGNMFEFHGSSFTTGDPSYGIGMVFVEFRVEYDDVPASPGIITTGQHVIGCECGPGACYPSISLNEFGGVPPETVVTSLTDPGEGQAYRLALEGVNDFPSSFFPPQAVVAWAAPGDPFTVVVVANSDPTVTVSTPATIADPTMPNYRGVITLEYSVGGGALPWSMHGPGIMTDGSYYHYDWETSPGTLTLDYSWVGALSGSWATTSWAFTSNAVFFVEGDGVFEGEVEPNTFDATDVTLTITDDVQRGSSAYRGFASFYCAWEDGNGRPAVGVVGNGITVPVKFLVPDFPKTGTESYLLDHCHGFNSTNEEIRYRYVPVWQDVSVSGMGRVFARDFSGEGTSGFTRSGPSRQLYTYAPLTNPGYTHLGDQTPICAASAGSSEQMGYIVVMVVRKYAELGGDVVPYEVLVAFEIDDAGNVRRSPDYMLNNPANCPPGDRRRAASIYITTRDTYGLRFYVVYEKPDGPEDGDTTLVVTPFSVLGCNIYGNIE